MAGIDPILALVFALLGGLITAWLLRAFRVRVRRRTRAVIVVGGGLVLGGLMASILMDM